MTKQDLFELRTKEIREYVAESKQYDDQWDEYEPIVRQSYISFNKIDLNAVLGKVKKLLEEKCK
jgi:hypothetical protein